MEALQLGIDPEDFIFDIVPAIERSFSIQFGANDFAAAGFTYGELCELVRSKLPAASATDCTTQQAFYKLRQALRVQVGEVEIRPSTRLADLLPARRREVVAGLDAALGLKSDLLTMPQWIEIGGFGLLLTAVVLLPGSLLAGALGGARWGSPVALLMLGCFGLTIVLFALGTRFGQRLRYQTAGELTEHLSTRYYRQMRRYSATVNQREVQARLDALFIDMEGLESAELLPEAVL